MSDPYTQREQRSAYDYGWDKAPMREKKRVMTPFDPSKGWRKASRNSKILASLAPLVPIACILSLAVPALLRGPGFLLTVLAFGFGIFSYNALHRILRPLDNAEAEPERVLRHFCYSAWWALVTPLITTQIVMGSMGNLTYDDEASGYVMTVFILGLPLAILTGIILLLWTIIAAVVRSSKR